MKEAVTEYRHYPHLDASDIAEHEKWYTGIRELRILIDPNILVLPNFNYLVARFVKLGMMLEYTQRVTRCGIDIRTLFPEYLAEDKAQNRYHAMIPDRLLVLNEEPPEVAEFKGSEATGYLEGKAAALLQERDAGVAKFRGVSTADTIQALLKSVESGELHRIGHISNLFEGKGRQLLPLFSALKCHLLLTENPILLGEKKELEKRGCIVVDLAQVAREVEVFLVGNGVFISSQEGVTSLAWGYTAQTFYPMTNPLFRRYEQLWAKVAQLRQNARANRYFQAALYHRYSFMQYARDHIEYEMRQASLVQDWQPHHFLASYHLNSFYIMLWGFLDNLAWAFNHIYSLGFAEGTREAAACTFRGKKYKQFIRSKSPAVWAVITDAETDKWIGDLAIKRHPAAHREPIYLTQIFSEQDMRLLADRMVVTDTDGGQVVYDAINHMEHDFKLLGTFMDKLCKVFEV